MATCASAELLYREIILAAPGDAQARHYLGYLLQQTDRLEEAREQLTRAIALDDRHAEWHFNLGIVLLRQGLAAPAIEAFSKAIAIDPEQVFLLDQSGCGIRSRMRNGRGPSNATRRRWTLIRIARMLSICYRLCI